MKRSNKSTSGLFTSSCETSSLKNTLLSLKSCFHHWTYFWKHSLELNDLQSSPIVAHSRDPPLLKIQIPEIWRSGDTAEMDVSLINKHSFQFCSPSHCFITAAHKWTQSTKEVHHLKCLKVEKGTLNITCKLYICKIWQFGGKYENKF